MLMIPHHNELTNEFAQIKNFIAGKCLSPMGKQLADEIAPVSNYQEIIYKLALIGDFIKILESGLIFPCEGYRDIHKELNLLRIQNATLQADQFRNVYELTTTAIQIIRFFQSAPVSFTQLPSLINNIPVQTAILKLTEDIFDQHFIVKSEASPALFNIRKTLTRKRLEVDRLYHSIILKWKKQGWVAETEESYRNGRRVVAIFAEQKRHLNGIIHDVSSTSKTVYLEPSDTIELNQLIVSLEGEERMEIARILREASGQLRNFSDILKAYFALVSKVDVIRASALFAVEIKASVPLHATEPVLDLSNARHPLLYIQNNAQKKKTVPFSITLNNDKRILVISGPNAGGKTVCMKTAALLQLMFQSGLPVTCDAHSTFGIFGKLLVDIGDSQSIEYELSTYSSRLRLMQQFLNNADKTSMFVIDEFGTGTDPELGGALAEAILEELNNRKCFGFITTHYLNLKISADHNPGIFNACMAFDPVRLMPQFELIVGKPGSSYTFMVAERSGLPVDVIKKAKGKVSKHHVMLENLLSQAEKDKSTFSRKLKELALAEQTLTELLGRYEKLIDENEATKNKLNNLLSLAEKKLVKQFDVKILKFLNEWKNSKNKKYVLEKYRNMHKPLKQQMSEEEKRAEDEKQLELLKLIKPGVEVRLKGSRTTGRVEKIQDLKATVVFGSIKTICHLKQLVPAHVKP